MVRISQASQCVNSSGEQIVDISSSAVVSVNDSTAQSSLSSLDTKITTCDTSSLATSANQNSANGLLTSIDSALGSTLIVDGSSSTQPISGSVTVSSVTDTVAVSGTVSVSSISGTVSTTTTAPSVSGSNNNHLSSQSVTSSYQSTGFDVSSASRFSIMGNTTDSSNSILVEFSPDNTNWYRANTELYPAWSDPTSPYDFYSSFEGACVKYVRLNFANYTTTETVNATILTQ